MQNATDNNTSRQELKFRRLVDYLVSDSKERIIKAAFPEIFSQKWFWKWRFHKWDVYDHTRETISNFKSMSFLPDKIKRYLNTQIDWISREALLLIAMAFHDSGKKPQFGITGKTKFHADYTMDNQFEAISERFHLTANQKEYVWNIIRYHDINPENLWPNEELFKTIWIYIEHNIISYCDLYATMWSDCSDEDLIIRRETVERRLLEIEI
ncbi:MAG: hypothetical protein ACD_2C00025G0010 [uncultured bacterium (gcode 4)]|uniref:HD domain-containing protein n=1 Tax=uncultured bacterium (gcode 4) TaxID=1234023 RepID=K2GIF8_9BACT|nr:MAG: hypothetical protein ACD_2C00025G0010 [uncultured bacterium (gcode 4)]